MTRSSPADFALADSNPIPSPSICFHCGLPLPDPQHVVTGRIQGATQDFCCFGCKGVCETIHAAGLEGFYRRTPAGMPLAPPPASPKDPEVFDLEEVQSEYVTHAGEECEVNLLVEGMHCAACVWLIERSLANQPGVREAQVNLTQKRLKVRWNTRAVRLSEIIRRMARIGYAAVPFDSQEAEDHLHKQNRALLYRMGFAGFAMMNLLWISIALYSGADRGEFRTLFHWAGFALATPTLLYSGFPFLRGAWTGLRHGHLGMDLPVAIGATITYLYSAYVTVAQPLAGDVYYDTLVNFLFVILVGRYLESTSKNRALASTRRLLELQPKVATVLRDGTERVVPVRAVRIGETVLIKPGSRVPVDGTVLHGTSAADESMLTGESKPARKDPGDTVSAGTLNAHGVLHVRAESLLSNTALGRIIHLVEEAQASKAPIQRLADRIVPWFVGVTLGLAAATFAWWVSSDFETALMAATAVLIITCPCAFGLATPMAIAVASGLGARHGILVKNGDALEILSAVDHFVFDKTGTLTEGRMAVSSIHTEEQRWEAHPGAAVPLPQALAKLLARLAVVERNSEHPVAMAIRGAAEAVSADVPKVSVTGFEYRPGLGVKALVDGTEVLLGTTDWLECNHAVRSSTLQDRARALSDGGTTPVHCAIAGREQAVIGISDPVREDAPGLLAALRREGVGLTLLSGDRWGAARFVAQRLGGMDTVAQVLPGEKSDVVTRLKARDHQVAMVGDGINDAPALVAADVGIALGSGTDVSIASAGIVLTGNALHKVWLALALSRRTIRTIRQNIGISVFYNIVMVPLAMAALITPLVAAISMPVSSLLVIGNAARIGTLFRPRKHTRESLDRTRPVTGAI